MGAQHRFLVGRRALGAWLLAARRRRLELADRAARCRALKARRAADRCLARWRAALGARRAEHEAERRRAERWRKVKGWLGEGD